MISAVSRVGIAGYDLTFSIGMQFINPVTSRLNITLFKVASAYRHLIWKLLRQADVVSIQLLHGLNIG